MIPHAQLLEEIRRRNRENLGLSGLLPHELAHASLAGAGDVLSFAPASLIASAVRSVRLRTQLTPEITLRPGELEPATDGGASSALALRLLRPELEVETPAGVVVISPYGRPRNLFPWLVAGGVIVAGIGTALVVRHVVRSRREANPRRRTQGVRTYELVRGRAA